MNKPVIVALDVANQQRLQEILDSLGPAPEVTIKIGMELFFNTGSQLVKDLSNQGYNIFLDLKLHDIPNTVYNGMKQLAGLGIKYTTVHALGGKDMIKAAKDGLKAGTSFGQSVPKLLAVTELTSISDEVLANEQNCKLTMTEQVVSLAKMAKEAGSDGVICSPLELKTLTKAIGPDFLYVTPGIRPNQNSHDDQARTATPSQAKDWGASAIVVGRPITLSSNPRESYQAIKEEFN